MTLILPPNWCLIFFRDSEATFTPTRLKELLQSMSYSISGEKEPFVVQLQDGPKLLVSVQHGSFMETIVRGLVGSRPKYRDLIPGCDAR